MNDSYEPMLEEYDRPELLAYYDGSIKTFNALDDLHEIAITGKWVGRAIASIEIALIPMPLSPSPIGKLAIAGCGVLVSGAFSALQRRIELRQPDVELELLAVERVLDRQDGVNPHLND
jgi:hypothetical protein